MRKNSKAVPVANKAVVKNSGVVNGSKGGGTGRQSLSPTRSLSPSLGKSPSAKPTSSRRTRSDRNSFTELSNGLEEGEAPSYPSVNFSLHEHVGSKLFIVNNWIHLPSRWFRACNLFIPKCNSPCCSHISSLIFIFVWKDKLLIEGFMRT